MTTIVGGGRGQQPLSPLAQKAADILKYEPHLIKSYLFKKKINKNKK